MESELSLLRLTSVCSKGTGISKSCLYYDLPPFVVRALDVVRVVLTTTYLPLQ